MNKKIERLSYQTEVDNVYEELCIKRYTLFIVHYAYVGSICCIGFRHAMVMMIIVTAVIRIFKIMIFVIIMGIFFSKKVII